MRWEATVVAVLGAAVLVASIVAARRPVISASERAVFRAVNGLPDALYWPLWVPMQLGNLLVGTAAGLVVAWAYRDWALAAAVVLAAVLKLVAERLVRRWTESALRVRQRPGTSEPGAVVRGSDVPRSGPSFPSGHVILAVAIACVVAVAIPGVWSWVPFLLAALVMFGRVYVGAHNPLDVTAGAGAGLLVGTVVAELLVR